MIIFICGSTIKKIRKKGSGQQIFFIVNPLIWDLASKLEFLKF